VTVKPLSATDWIFRDVGAVFPNFLQFSTVIAAATLAVNKGIVSPEKNNQIVKTVAGLCEKAAHWVGAAEKTKDFDWYKLAETAISRWLIMGAGFASFNPPYNAMKQKYNEHFNSAAPESNLPKPSGDAVKDFFTRGVGRMIFRNVGGLFMSALPLGVTAALVGKVIGDKTKDGKTLIDPESIKLFGENEDNKKFAASAEKFSKAYLLSAPAFAAYFATYQQFGNLYDKFWDNWGKKKSPSENHEDEALKPKESAKYKFFKEGLGKILLRDVGSCLVGFIPNRFLWLAIKDLIGEPAKDKTTGKMLLAGGKMKPLQDALNEAILKSEIPFIDANFFTELFANSVGFSAYIGTSEIYRNIYDRLVDKMKQPEPAASKKADHSDVYNRLGAVQKQAPAFSY